MPLLLLTHHTGGLALLERCRDRGPVEEVEPSPGLPCQAALPWTEMEEMRKKISEEDGLSVSRDTHLSLLHLSPRGGKARWVQGLL